MYVYQTKIKLHQTDAAGLLFFAHQFELMHDAYESLLEKIGFGFAKLISKSDYFLPIVHAQADYKKPLFVEDLIDIEVKVLNIGKTSFTFSYQILNENKELVGTGETVHVTMDKKTSQKIPIPADMRQKIEDLKD